MCGSMSHIYKLIALDFGLANFEALGYNNKSSKVTAELRSALLAEPMMKSEV